MRAIIFTGGEIYPDGITTSINEDDLVIAADSGYLNALTMKAGIDILVGDMDSLKHAKQTLPDDITIHSLPCEKDFTDTQFAVDTAIKEGATELMIIGGLSGRLDHTLSSLAILEDLYARHIPATMTDGINRVRYTNASGVLIPRSHFTYFSVLAADSIVKGVNAEGCKYPLKNATLKRNMQFAVSNEIVGNCAHIWVRKGGVFVIESRDRPK